MSVGLKWFLNRVFGSRYWFVGLCVLLVSAGVAYASVSVPVGVTYPDLTPTDAQPYVIEVPFAEWDYFVGQMSNGSNYAVNASNWDVFALDVNDSGVVQECIDAGDVVVYMKGNFTFDYTVYYDDHNPIFVEGSVFAGDGLDAPIFQNKNLTGSNHDCMIAGVGGTLTINGNAGEQSGTTARGIVFDQHGAEVPNLYLDYEVGYVSGLTLENVEVVNCRDEGLYYNASSSSLTQSSFDRVSVRMCGLTGGTNVYLQGFTDSRWMTGLIQGDASIYGIHAFGVASSEFGGGLYMNGKHLFQYCNKFDFHPFEVDNGGAYNTTTWEGCYECNIHPSHMNYFGDDNNTHTAIVMKDWIDYADCISNKVYDITFGAVGGGGAYSSVGANWFKYGVFGYCV